MDARGCALARTAICVRTERAPRTT
jgi:hypothetical protein